MLITTEKVADAASFNLHYFVMKGGCGGQDVTGWGQDRDYMQRQAEAMAATHPGVAFRVCQVLSVSVAPVGEVVTLRYDDMSMCVACDVYYGLQGRKRLRYSWHRGWVLWSFWRFGVQYDSYPCYRRGVFNVGQRRPRKVGEATVGVEAAMTRRSDPISDTLDHPDRPGDFCRCCGASIPPRKGELTCSRCDPEGVKRHAYTHSLRKE